MSSNRIRNTFLAVAVLVMIGTAVLLRGYGIQVNRTDTAQQGEASAKQTTQVVGDLATDQSDQILAICRGKSDAASALKEAGACGTASDTKTQVAQATPGAPGATGPQGPRGINGLSATSAQVASAVRSYCAVDDRCVGPSGKNGETGAAGSDGQPGAAGQPGAKGDTGAKGEKGDTGSTGSAGSPGRGIVGLSCDGGLAPVTYTVTYTDGTSDTFTCGALAPIEP